MKNQIMEHLLFHKALISEDEEGKRIDGYIEIANSMDKEYPAIKNSFDREIMIAFELVREEHLDPWDIDLNSFSKMYLKRVRKEKDIDLITAGYIILTAWTILKLQSDKVLESVQEKEEEELTWDTIPDWFTENGEYDYTTKVLEGRPPIEEPIRRKGERKVTLFELVEAFNDVKRTMKLRELMRQDRKKQKIFEEKNGLENINKKMHKENMEEDMGIIWNRICKLNGTPIPLSNLHNGDKNDFITTVMSILFLANDGRIRIWQRNFPYGEIYVKRCSM